MKKALPSWRSMQVGESVTSWVIRLARANAMGLHELGTRALGMSKHSTMHCDFDIRQKQVLTDGLAQLGNISSLDIWLQSLASHRQRLSTVDTESANRFRIRWLLLRSKGTHQVAQSPWTQACPACLAEDKEPYFRYWWRLAFLTECPIHEIPLIDRCPSCSSVIDFTKSERSPPLAEDWYPLSRCPHCQFSWDKMLFVDKSDQLLIQQQKLMLQALSNNWIMLQNDDVVWSGLFFDGCYRLIREMRRPPAGWKLFDRLVRDSPTRTNREENQSMPFESLEIDERREWLKGLFVLLDDWPQRLIDEARQVRFTLSYLRGQLGSSPYWIDKHGVEYLDRRWYKNTVEEKESAADVLRRCTRDPGKIEVASWIGKATPDQPNGLKKAWPGVCQRNLPGLNINDSERLRAVLARKIVKILWRYCVQLGKRKSKDVNGQLLLPF